MIYLGLVLRLWQSSVTQDGVYLISSYEGWAITGEGAAYSSRLPFADIIQRRLLVNTPFLCSGSPPVAAVWLNVPIIIAELGDDLLLGREHSVSRGRATRR